MATERTRRGWLRRATVLAIGLLVVSGCSGREFKRVPVSGTVTLDGTPLNGGVLHFYPDTTKGNNYRVDCLSPVRNGKFTLITTAVRDTDTGNGAPAGWYKVYLFFEPSAIDIKIHSRFTDPEKTPISIEVVETPKDDSYVIKFTSK